MPKQLLWYQKTVRLLVDNTISDAALQEADDMLGEIDLKAVFEAKVAEIADTLGEAFRNVTVEVD